MDAELCRHALFISGTVGTIRHYTRKKRAPFLEGLLDDIIAAAFAVLSRSPPEEDTPRGFHESILRILTFLAEEALKNHRPDIAQALSDCQAAIAALPENRARSGRR